MKNIKNITARINFNNPKLFNETLRESRLYEVLDFKDDVVTMKRTFSQNEVKINKDQINNVTKSLDSDWYNLYIDLDKTSVEDAKKQLTDYAKAEFDKKIRDLNSEISKLRSVRDFL